MAYPSFVASTALISVAQTTNPVPWPAHVSDDLAFLFVETDSGTITLSTPAGFTLVQRQTAPTGTASTQTALAVFVCRATSSAMTTPVVAQLSNHSNAAMVLFRNAELPNNSLAAGAIRTTTSTSITFAAVPTDNQTLVVGFAAIPNDISTAWVSALQTISLVSMTERLDASATNGNGGGLFCFTGQRLSAGLMSAQTATITSSTSAATITIPLQFRKPGYKIVYSGGTGTIPSSPATSTSTPINWDVNSIPGDVGEGFLTQVINGNTAAAGTLVVVPKNPVSPFYDPPYIGAPIRIPSTGWTGIVSSVTNVGSVFLSGASTADTTSSGEFTVTLSGGAAQTATAQVATSVFTGIAGTTTGATSSTAQVAQGSFGGVAGATSAGDVSTTAQIGSLSFTGIAGTATVGGSPQSATAQIASVSFTGIPSAATAGAASKAAQVAALAFAGVVGVVTTGAVSVSAQIGSSSFAGVAGTTSSGAASPQTVTAQIGTVSFAGVAGTTSTSVSRTAQIATLTFTGIAGSKTAAATATAQISTASFTGVAGTSSSAISKAAQVASLAFTGISGTVSTGAVSKAAQVASLAFTGISGTVSTGAVSKAAQVASLAFTGVPSTVSLAGGAPQTATAQIAALAFSGVQGVVTLTASITAQVGAVSMTALTSSITVGGTSKTAQTGAFTSVGIAGSVLSGAVSTSAQIGAFTFAGVAGALLGAASKISQIGAVTLSGITGTLVIGGSTKQSQIGLLTFTPLTGVVARGGVSKTAQIGVMTFQGLSGIPILFKSHLFYWDGARWSPATSKTWDGAAWVPDARVKAYSSASSSWLSTNSGV